MYYMGNEWKNWMKDYRFGTLAFLPKGELGRVSDQLRSRWDPASSKSCPAHITISQPFTVAPDLSQIDKIKEFLNQFKAFELQIGLVRSSPNKKLIWLDVNPKQQILQIRDGLHDLNLFRLDLPFTNGFIPHLTISEVERSPYEAKRIIDDLNSLLNPWNILFDSVSWIIPDENFIFQEYKSFKLIMD